MRSNVTMSAPGGGGKGGQGFFLEGRWGEEVGRGEGREGGKGRNNDKKRNGASQ